MSTIVCGSIAFDNIMSFEGKFSEHIIPDKLEMLNVSFLVPGMRQEFGGCAGNIAYNLKKLGSNPLVSGSVGKDFSAYAEWMDKNRIERRFISETTDSYTAQAFIITDSVGNQITAFHPGAMENPSRHPVFEIEADFAIVSPDSKKAMIENCNQLSAAKIPFIFDPGQGTPMFDGDELMELISLSNWIIVNEYESKMIEAKSSLSSKQIAKEVDAYIVTLGDKGSKIYSNDNKILVDAVSCELPVDPTGCGDAFRAGFIFGLENKWSTIDAVRLGSVLGSVKVGSRGTQNHTLSKEGIKVLLDQNYKIRPRW
ncbi:carbohydrate kinase family protein [Pseudomonadota bacterium]|nr:carbohydrate kinase family protein [Pseudomonadota bacterium]